MKKSKVAVALKRQLKGLIIPMILFLVIMAGVLVIAFWKEEPEQVEIVKVNAYEGETREMVLENQRIRFSLNPATTQFTVTDKITGEVWDSNPVAAGNDPIAMTVEKQKLQSTLLLTYSTINGVDTLYSNYTYSIDKGIYDIEEGEDYIKVFYSIGDTDKEFAIPPVITEVKMESLMDAMSKTDVQFVANYYKNYDINNLGKKDDREELLANYPILETERIYVLRSGMKDNIKGRLEEIFERAGYTLVDLAEDKELDLTQTVSDKPLFNVNIIYRLEGDDLLVEVPLDEIEYKVDYPLVYLSILPYFGAAGVEDEGFMLVPEGGGALIRFNNGKTTQNSYYVNIYGWDMAQDRAAIVHDTRSTFNVYGMAREDSSFLCILEEGAPYAAVQADVSGKANSYNYVNAVYEIVHREQYDVADKYTGSMYVYQQELPKESLITRFRFIDSGNYVDMAESYRQYLLDAFDGYLIKREDAQTPAVIEILGAADKVKQVVGIPVTRPLKLTGYDETVQMLQELQQDGIENMSVKLTGWMNGGIQQKIIRKVKLVPELGSSKEFADIIGYAEKKGIALYLDGVTNYACNSGITTGFFVPFDTARFVSGEQAELYEYSTVTYGKDNREDTYYLLKPELIEEAEEKLWRYVQDYNVNISFQDIGKELSSDFNEESSVSRQAMLQKQAQWIKEAKESGTGVMVNAGNDYVLPYCDMVTNMELSGSKYTIIDESVPFYQMAVHGYINYTGEPLNLAQNYEEELLNSVEYGAGLHFTLMKESAFILQNTSYYSYFGADYTAWHDKLVDIYTRYNEELGHIYNQRMVDHQILPNKLTCTVYEDGTRVYVNYGYEDRAVVDGTVVPARDYVAIKQ